MSSIETEIRRQFPGKANAGIRAKLRCCKNDQQVRSLRFSVALTAFGLASLEAVAKAFATYERVPSIFVEVTP